MHREEFPFIVVNLAGQTLDRYEMLEEVGHGGMAVVYRGRDSKLNREVAVKVLHAHLSDREESKQRLQREALTVARLRHEHIVEIYDYSGSGPESRSDESYIVTEFIHGVTLREWLDERWEPRPSLAAMTIHRLLLPLQHAHAMGIVHRDIKPENVMIRNDGCIKLMDFGIAQILDQQKLTMTGQLLGSPAYMAPELICGKPVDARTDLFAVGILLYQLATGELPFSGRNPHEVLHRISDGEYPDPQKVCSRVDADLTAIIAKALSSDPRSRYQSAEAFASELDNYLKSIGIDSEQGDIFEYFKGTEGFLENHDRQVCNALLKQATASSRSGQTAKAFLLLGRVLELDPSNHHAKTLLAALKQRGHRMRQLLMGGATLAFVGLVGASYLLYQNMPPGETSVNRLAKRSSNNTESTERSSLSNAEEGEPSDLSEQVLADQHEGGTLDSKRRSLEQTMSGTKDSRGKKSSEAPANNHPPRAQVRARQNPKSGGKNDARSASPSQTKADEKHHCSIQVSKVPAAGLLAGSYFVVGGGKRSPVSGTGAAQLEVEKQHTVRLSGPRYQGQVTVSPALCESGPRTLSAQPRPAQLVFKPVNVPLDRLTVECVRQSCNQGKTLASRFGSLPVPEGQSEWSVSLTYRATGFRKKTDTVHLMPGRNEIPVELEPIR